MGDKFEVWSTRLFPKGQGADAYRLTGAAARCDWVVLSDNAEPHACLRVRPDAPASPRTIFLSLRKPWPAYELFARDVLPVLETPFVLFSGSEDVTTPNQTDRRWPATPQHIRSIMDSILAHPQLTAWYTENLDADIHPKLRPMPLGLLTEDGGPAMAEVQEFEELARRPLTVLCAHRHRDGPQWEPRRKVSAIARAAWTGWTTILDEPVEEAVFKRLLSRHAFVLCVEGGGLDPSPKAWLALLHGAIPIIRKSPTAAAYEDLPVVMIDDWESGAITLEKLAEWRSRLSADFQQKDGWREDWFNRLSFQTGWNRRAGRVAGESQTKSETSVPSTPAVARPQDPPPPTRYQVVSPGGPAAGVLARWLEPEGPPAIWILTQSQRRQPPPPAFRTQKFIYVFSDPRNVALSLFHQRSGQLSRPDSVSAASGKQQTDPSAIDPGQDLKTCLKQGRDPLQLEEHFDNWFHADQPYPVLFVRYESLPDTAAQLGRWLGLQRPVPGLEQAEADWRTLPADEQAALDAVYGDFARRLESLPGLILRQQGQTFKI